MQRVLGQGGRVVRFSNWSSSTLSYNICNINQGQRNDFSGFENGLFTSTRSLRSTSYRSINYRKRKEHDYTKSIIAYASYWKIWNVVAYMEEMQGQGYAPSEYVRKKVALQASRHPKVATADYLFRYLHFIEADLGLHPSEEVLKHETTFAARSGYSQRSTNLLNALEETFDMGLQEEFRKKTLAWLYYSQKDAPSLERLLGEVEKDSTKLKLSLLLMDTIGRNTDVSKAFAVFNLNMGKKGVDCLFSNCKSTDEIEKVYTDLKQKFEIPERDLIHSRRVAYAFKGDTTNALRNMDEDATGVTLILSQAFGKTGNIEKLEEVFNRVPEEKKRAHYKAAVSAGSENGQIHVLDYLNKKDDKLFIKIGKYGRCFAKIGDVKKCKELLEQHYDTDPGITPEEVIKASAVGIGLKKAVILALCKTDDPNTYDYVHESSKAETEQQKEITELSAQNAKKVLEAGKLPVLFPIFDHEVSHALFHLFNKSNNKAGLGLIFNEMKNYM